MVALKDTLISPAAYNSLPHISAVTDAPDTHAADLADLRSLLARHRVPKGVSVRLIHKHFDAYNNEVMAFKQVTAKPFGNILVMRPESRDSSRLRGVNYFVDQDNSLQAYEYADSDVTDMTKYSAFVDEFCALVAKRGLQRKFGLKLQSDWEVPSWTEFEFPCERSTMVIPKGLPVPEGTAGVNVITEWGAEDEMGAPTEGWCITHPRQCHHCKCIKPDGEEEDSWVGGEWYLGGNKVVPGSPVHCLVSAVVEVW